jgi:heat-inducible transcriptional repressor
MLTTRQEKILECVVKEYTRTAQSVGSKNLLNRYKFGVSPATMRAEMFELERLGYLYHPHTSSGRIPTDKGYRFFVASLMKDKELSRKDQISLQEELWKLRAKSNRMARTAAKMLSVLSHNLAISGVVEEEEYFQSGIKELLSQPEFTDIDGICRIVEVLDYLDQNIADLLVDLKQGEVKALIGKENPLVKGEQCSIVVARCRLPEGETGIIAIMGPKRMEYAKNISLVRYVSEVLEGRAELSGPLSIKTEDNS